LRRIVGVIELVECRLKGLDTGRDGLERLVNLGYEESAPVPA
jgi:hypothetical protein